MAAAEEPNTGELTAATMIDDAYEFSAPRFFDFIEGESEEDKRRAELWFDSALTYAPSREFLFHPLLLRLLDFPFCF